MYQTAFLSELSFCRNLGLSIEEEDELEFLHVQIHSKCRIGTWLQNTQI